MDIKASEKGWDWLQGDGGKDKLYGQGGSEILNGGVGNDKLYAGTGNDTLAGGLVVIHMYLILVMIKTRFVITEKIIT